MAAMADINKPIRELLRNKQPTDSYFDLINKLKNNFKEFGETDQSYEDYVEELTNRFQPKAHLIRDRSWLTAYINRRKESLSAYLNNERYFNIEYTDPINHFNHINLELENKAGKRMYKESPDLNIFVKASFYLEQLNNIRLYDFITDIMQSAK